MTDEPKKFSQTRWAQFLLGLLLFCLTIAAYEQVWRAGFIWDDDVYVTANPLLTAPDGWWRIWFTLDSPSQYFPLTYSVFRLEHMLWGLNPVGYHCVNIVLHALNGVLLWRLLRLFRIPGAWLAAALFALHPVQVESVAWITELKNVLMGFFFLLTLWCWARFIKKETRARVAYYVGALLFFALALFSKTTACTLPAALLLMLWLKHKKITLSRWAQVLPFVVMAGAMGAVTVWWERFHQGTQGAHFAVGYGERVLLAARAVWFYLGKLFWPRELIFSYPHWTVSLADPWAYLWLGGLILAAIAILIARRWTGRGIEVAAIFFVATLSPVLGFIMLWTFRYSWVADHYQYLACIGPIALFAAGAERVALSLGQSARWIVGLLCAALLVSLGGLTWKQSANYADAETLWRATIASNPRSALAHNSLGVLLGAKGAPLAEEMEEYVLAVAQDPGNAEAHNNLGFALQRDGRLEEARAEYEKAIAADARYMIPHGNLATVLMRLGRLDEAAAQMEALLAMEPANAGVERSLGEVRSQQGRKDEAIQHWERALALQPNDGALHGMIGAALAGEGKMAEAAEHLRRAAELAPEDAQAHFLYGSALSLSDRYAESIPEYREALRLHPSYPEAHMNLAVAYLRSERFAEAITEYESILAFYPDDPTAHKNLALLLHHFGRDEEAAVHERRAAEIESAQAP